ncbi:MAG: APC family permease [Firmicutes bacterium]|nr:APC family permease [Bacillota bacterium]
MTEENKNPNVDNIPAGSADEAAALGKLHYKQELKRVMGLPSVVFFGIAYLAPITIFTTYGLITNMTHGMLSLAYVVATCAMIFTAFSYRQMVKAFPIAGSVYTYVQQTFNPHLGFMSGWAILLDYILLPMFDYVALAVYMKILVPQIPATVWMLLFIILVTIVNVCGMSITKMFNNTLILIQIVFLVSVIIFAIKYVAGGGGLGTFTDFTAFYNAAEFHTPEVGWAGIWAGAAILCISFLGFDSVTTIAEETRNPSKTIGSALIIICLAAGCTFIFVSYIMQAAWPEGWFSFTDPDSGAYDWMVHVVGPAMGIIFSAIFVIGATASAVASSASAARILFGMGRDGLLPNKVFGYVNKKTQVPTVNILLVGVISLSCLLLDLSAAASLINFGALLGFIMVNLSVVFFYYVQRKKRGGSAILNFIILPCIGIIVDAILWLSLDSLSKILGCIWLVIGFVFLLISTKGLKQLPPTMKWED